MDILWTGIISQQFSTVTTLKKDACLSTVILCTQYFLLCSVSPLWWRLRRAAVLAGPRCLRGGCGRWSTHQLPPWTSHPETMKKHWLSDWANIHSWVTRLKFCPRRKKRRSKNTQNFVAPYQMLPCHLADAHHANGVRRRVRSVLLVLLWCVIHKVTRAGGRAFTGLGCHWIVSLQQGLAGKQVIHS